MVCSIIYWIFGLMLEMAFEIYTNRTIDPQAQREGGFDHWLACRAGGYGQAQGSSRGDQVEDVNSFGLDDNELSNDGNRVDTMLFLVTYSIAVTHARSSVEEGL
jgi:hypothetical protein